MADFVDQRNESHPNYDYAEETKKRHEENKLWDQYQNKKNLEIHLKNKNFAESHVKRIEESIAKKNGKTSQEVLNNLAGWKKTLEKEEKLCSFYS